MLGVFGVHTTHSHASMKFVVFTGFARCGKGQTFSRKIYIRLQRLHHFSSWQEHLHPIYFTAITLDSRYYDIDIFPALFDSTTPFQFSLLSQVPVLISFHLIVIAVMLSREKAVQIQHVICFNIFFHAIFILTGFFRYSFSSRHYICCWQIRSM